MDAHDRAAPRWGDKMRTLGYDDAYLGFLTAQAEPVAPGTRVIDIGAGTGAFAEAWVAARGRPAGLTLLDPSPAMLDRGRAAIAGRGVEPRLVRGRPGEVALDPADVALAAHVVEHCPDPGLALAQMASLLRPGVGCILSSPSRTGATRSSGCNGATGPLAATRSCIWSRRPGFACSAPMRFRPGHRRGQARGWSRRGRSDAGPE